jgi:hypothetical protein
MMLDQARGLPAFITSSHVAQLLDLPSAASFLARRDELEDLGFPLPVAWSARPLKWRLELVQGWIDRQGRPRAVGQRPQLVNPDYLMARAATA